MSLVTPSEYPEEFRRQRDAFEAMSRVLRQSEQNEQTEAMLLVLAGLADICERLAVLAEEGVLE